MSVTMTNAEPTTWAQLLSVQGPQVGLPPPPVQLQEVSPQPGATIARAVAVSIVQAAENPAPSLANRAAPSQDGSVVVRRIGAIFSGTAALGFAVGGALTAGSTSILMFSIAGLCALVGCIAEAMNHRECCADERDV